MTTPEDNAKTEERLKDEYLIAALDYAHDMIDAHKSQPGYFDLKLLRLRALRQIRVIIAGRQAAFEEVARLQADLKLVNESWHLDIKQIHTLQAELERVTKERDELKIAVSDAHANFMTQDEQRQFYQSYPKLFK